MTVKRTGKTIRIRGKDYILLVDLSYIPRMYFNPDTPKKIVWDNF